MQLSALKDWIFGRAQDEYADEEYGNGYEDEEMDEEVEDSSSPRRGFSRFGRRQTEESEDSYSSGQERDNVVQFPNQNKQSSSIVICRPTRYEETSEICTYLKERSSVLINFENVDKETAQRIVDFVSGTVFAIEGDLQRISNDTIAASPSNVDLVSKKAETRERGRFSFYR